MGILGRFKKEEKPGEGTPDVLSVSELKDFHPYETGLAQAVEELSAEFHQKGCPAPRPCERDQFIALLAGVSALRRTPGIPGPTEDCPDYFITLPRCASPEAEAECRTHLEKVFGITNRQSLLEFCRKEICCHSQYLDFTGFWENHPPFAMDQLNKDAADFFQAARNFSAQFYPIVGHRGYLAWDICECVGHLRTGYACGILNREELDEMAEHWIAQAQVFENWADFAVSLICGELYWDFRHGAKLPELNQGLELWTRLVRILMEEGTAWGSGMWYKPIDAKQQR